MKLIAVGINYETAPVEVRECFAFSEADCENALRELTAEEYVNEAIILSTCNRTELYARYGMSSGKTPEQITEALIMKLARIKKVDGVTTDMFFHRYDDEAVKHMMRVCCGLESMIKGEAQILSQVKNAYTIACRAKSCGFFFHKLMHIVFRAGKRGRTETDIGIGAVSVSLAAVELAGRIFKDLGRKNALVVGAGEMAGLTAQHFADKGVASLTVINRTEENAKALASKLGGKTAPFDRLAGAIAESDVVIASTSSKNFIITPDIMRDAMKLRRNKSVFLIDIAVPRNIDPAVKKVYNVFAHDIDDLKQIVDKNLERRNSEAPKVEKIILQELDNFRGWLASLEVTPTIKDLVGQIEEIRMQEIRKSEKYFTREQLEHVDALTKSIVKKILHTPISKLQESRNNETEDTPYLVDTVRNVFNLGKETNE